LSDPANAVRTLGHAAGVVGVSSKTLTRWRGNAAFNRAVAEEAAKYIDPRLAEVYAAMIDKAVGGDVGAARLVCEIRRIIGGKAGPAVEVNVEQPVELVLSWNQVERRSPQEVEEAEERAAREPDPLEIAERHARALEAGALIDPVEEAATRERERAAREKVEREAAEDRRRAGIVRENLRAFEERKRRRFAEEAGTAWELGDPSTW